VEKVDGRSGAGSDLYDIFNQKALLSKEMSKSVTSPAVVVVRTSVFKKHAVGGEKELPTGFENTKSFPHVASGIGNMFENLGGKNDVVRVGFFLGQSGAQKNAVDRRTGNDIGADVWFTTREDISIGFPSAPVVEERSRHGLSEV
jgi:hypothetical protein